jgi:hypothetical protein
MAGRYVVCGEDGFVSVADDGPDDEGEDFATLAKARKRAEQLAKELPGEKYTIYEAVAVVYAPVGKPITENL